MVMAVPREDATVILTLDVSGSMKATDVDPTRLDAARAAAQSFIDQLPAKVRVGIVAFASEPQTLVSPTTDRAQLKAALDSLRPRDGTAMGDALMQVLDIAQQIQADATAPDASAAPPPARHRARARRHRRRPAPPSDRPMSRRASRSSPRSCCPTARTRSARPNRSMPPSARRR